LKLGQKTSKGVISTGEHTVTLLEDKIVKGLDIKGKEIEYVEYIVEENGEKKSYRTKLRGSDNLPSYLVQEMASYPEGSKIVMKLDRSGAKNYVSVRAVGDEKTVEVDEEEWANDEQTIT